MSYNGFNPDHLASWPRALELRARLQEGEDRHKRAVASFYGLTMLEVEEKLAKGFTIGRALGHTILIPPDPCTLLRPTYDPS